MRIAIDLRRILNPGVGRYMKCLVETILKEAPQHDYLLILPPGAEGMVSGGDGNVQRLVSDLKYYSIREQIRLPFLLRRYEADILHAPHIMVPLLCPCPVAVTLHDVIPLTCDLPDPPSRLGRLYFRIMVYAAARLSDSIITDSQYSKDDIVRCLGTHPNKVEVICPGIDPGFRPVRDISTLEQVRRKYRIAGEYILYTGIYKPRKNHHGLLEAMRQLLGLGVDARLVIAGPMKEGESQLRRAATEMGIAGKVILTGFVDDADLAALYSAARVYACPSLYEGFGFTILEAMACGTPVVSSRETSLAEVGRDGVLFADPRRPVEFAAALARVFTDDTLRQQLVQAGFVNVQRFSWKAAAQATLAVYEHTLGTAARTASVSA